VVGCLNERGSGGKGREQENHFVFVSLKSDIGKSKALLAGKKTMSVVTNRINVWAFVRRC
jgi:hypothetical protein